MKFFTHIENGINRGVDWVLSASTEAREATTGWGERADSWMTDLSTEEKIDSIQTAVEEGVDDFLDTVSQSINNYLDRKYYDKGETDFPQDEVVDQMDGIFDEETFSSTPETTVVDDSVEEDDDTPSRAKIKAYIEDRDYVGLTDYVSQFVSKLEVASEDEAEVLVQELKEVGVTVSKNSRGSYIWQILENI